MKTYIIKTGHTLKELEKVHDNDCRDFSLEDFWSGAIEPQEGMVYWLVNNRIYETKK